MTYTEFPGTATSVDKDAYKRDLTLTEIDIRTPEQMDFTQAVVSKTTDALDLHFQLPKTGIIPAFKITEGQTTPRQRVGWFQDATTLYGYRTAIEISETSYARGDFQMQWDASVEAVVDSFTMAHDQEILASLYDGANTNNTVSALSTWSDQSGKNIIGDVAQAVRKVLKTNRGSINQIKTWELDNLAIFYPSELMVDVDIPELIYDNGTSGGQMGYNIPNQTQMGVLRNKNFTFIPTSRLNGETFALGVIRSPKCAIHWTYEGPMPRIKNYENIEAGTEGYMVSQYFRTQIVPQSSTQATNDRIFIIDGVAEA